MNPLLGLLGSARSLNAARDALRKLGLPARGKDLERVAGCLVEELELGNIRPLEPNRVALCLDGKYVEIRDGDRLRAD